MNQDKYPGVYAAMGEMEMKRNERPPMGGMETRRREHFPMNEAELKRCERFPMNEMEMRRHERPRMEEIRYQEHANVDCIDREQVIEDPRLAHAYVPIQKLCSTFTPITALRNGTIFPGLVNVYGWESKEFGRDNI